MTTPIIIAALARRPRRNPRAVRTPGGEGGSERGAHNYLAQASKKQPGAPLGNRNAARRTQEQADRLAQMDEAVRRFSATADAAIAMVDRFCAERALLAALLRGPR